VCKGERENWGGGNQQRWTNDDGRGMKERKKERRKSGKACVVCVREQAHPRMAIGVWIVISDQRIEKRG